MLSKFKNYKKAPTGSGWPQVGGSHLVLDHTCGVGGGEERTRGWKKNLAERFALDAVLDQ
jgi:hypothetical protein